ncbi:MAG: hypothetical protein ABEJ44_00980 [Halanaeroarchaeum sp.]
MVEPPESFRIDGVDADDLIGRLFRNRRNNALIAWSSIVVLVSVFVESVFDGDIQWIVFVLFVGVVVLIPPIAFREWRVMLPWELLVLAQFPILVRGISGGTVGTIATYVALSGVALVIVVELHMFTRLRVTPWFAVTLVTMATLASVAVWSMFRWIADEFLGTSYLVDNHSLMIEWIYVTFAGVVAGLLFDMYFSRRDRILWRNIRRLFRR